MKISYRWLKEFVEFDFDAQTLAEKLTLAGFEVEDVSEKRLDYPGVVVGKVLKKEKHPNADKLTVCTVTVGEAEPLAIICGAPNVAEGQVVPVARIGTRLPIGLTIEKAKIRGVSSQGMICSRQELGLEDDSEGIWVLPGDLAIGEALAQALRFETDYAIDLSVTPNRPDALSHIGIAREVAAIAGKRLQLPEPRFPETSDPASDSVAVEILCPESCPRYAARLIRSVKIGPSPGWMARRLEAVGMRSINNIVDITNYVMMETGHPLHAFDYDLLEGGKIIVRESEDGELFITLDEKKRELRRGTVLICDAARPVAIGGIMGGLNSEVHPKTAHILLESAYFQPESIRKSVRYLGINSEASQRFERGADPNGVIYAQSRAVQLMAELAGGEVCRGVVDNYSRIIHPVEIDLKTEQINKLLGTTLSAEEMATLLAGVELTVRNGKVVAPTFRPDVRRTADIAEEVARRYGYDKIPVSEKTAIPYQTVFNPFDDYLDELKNILTGMGLQEVVTNSMINSRVWEKLTGQPVYPILNPINPEMDGMRNSLVPSLMGVLQWNLNRQAGDLAIFEINKIFYHPGDITRQPREEYRLALALAGLREGSAWHSDRQLFDFYDIKGFIQGFAGKISLDNLGFIAYDNFAVESQAARILAGKEEIGYLGKVRNDLQKHFDIETPVYVAELDLQKIYDLTRVEKKYREIPKFPAVERDLAVVIDRERAAEDLISAIEKEGGKYLRRVFVFDVYSGKQIDPEKKSLAFRLIFQAHEKTLTEGEVNEAIDNILRGLEKTFGARIRS